MDYYDILLAKKLSGGGGSSVDVESLSVTENGTYTAETGKAYSPVTVNVDSSKWTRPSDWPDISKLSRTGQVVYLTYPANEDDGFISATVTPAYKVAVGHIENDSYVVESEASYTSNTTSWTYFGEANNTGYKVIRITSTGNITKVDIGHTTSIGGKVLDGKPLHRDRQWLLEVYGNLPYVTTINFWRMSHLESVDITNAKPTNFAKAFMACRELRNIKGLDTWDMSNNTSLESTFNGCEYLEHVDVKNLCKASCTTLASVFSGCTGLKELDLSTWATSGVTTFSSAFNTCRELKTLTLPSQFVTSTATNISSMFAYLNSLESLDMSGWDTSNVTNMTQMFYYTTCFDSIDFTGLDLRKVTSTANNNGMYMMVTASLVLRITFPALLTAVTGFGTYTNQDIVGTEYEFHFLSTTVPTMNGAYIASNYPSNAKKIYVPYSADHSILEAYKTATNWSQYASYIFEEPQS